jgi:hypothetical protein
VLSLYGRPSAVWTIADDRDGDRPPVRLYLTLLNVETVAITAAPFVSYPPPRFPIPVSGSDAGGGDSKIPASVPTAVDAALATRFGLGPAPCVLRVGGVLVQWGQWALRVRSYRSPKSGGTSAIGSDAAAQRAADLSPNDWPCAMIRVDALPPSREALFGVCSPLHDCFIPEIIAIVAAYAAVGSAALDFSPEGVLMPYGHAVTLRIPRRPPSSSASDEKSGGDRDKAEGTTVRLSYQDPYRITVTTEVRQGPAGESTRPPVRSTSKVSAIAVGEPEVVPLPLQSSSWNTATIRTDSPFTSSKGLVPSALPSASVTAPQRRVRASSLSTMTLAICRPHACS